MASNGPQGNHDEEIADRSRKATDIDTANGVPIKRKDGKEGVDGLKNSKELGEALNNLPGERLNFLQKLRETEFHVLGKGFQALTRDQNGFSVAFFTDAVETYQENNRMIHGDSLRQELSQDYSSESIEEEFEAYTDNGLLTDSPIPAFTGEAVETYNLVSDLMGEYDQMTVMTENASGRLDHGDVARNDNADIRSLAVSYDLEALSFQESDGMRGLMYIAESPGSATSNYHQDDECEEIFDELMEEGFVESGEDVLQLTEKGVTAYEHVDRFYSMF